MKTAAVLLSLVSLCSCTRIDQPTATDVSTSAANIDALAAAIQADPKQTALDVVEIRKEAAAIANRVGMPLPGARTTVTTTPNAPAPAAAGKTTP
jgi:hypothetical protein